MKNITKILTIAAAIFFAASCDLSEYNPNALSDATAFSSADNIQLILNDFYTAWPTIDKAYGQESGKVEYIEAGNLIQRYQASYTSQNWDEWGGWGSLRNINYFLTMINSSACKVTGEQKEDFEAQGRFFRAYWYWKKYRAYGDMPWYDSIVSESEQWNDRESRDVIVKHIIDDLDWAYEHMTIKCSTDGTNLTPTVIKFVKMQVCLYEASFRKYNNLTKSDKDVAYSNYTVEQLYELAAQAAKDIIDAGQYSLVPSYRSLFQSTTLLTQEVILGAQTDSQVMGSQNKTYNYTGEFVIRPFINTFLKKDGTPYTASAGYKTAQWKDEFTDRDPRLKDIVRYPGYEFGEGTEKKAVVPNIILQNSNNGYQVIKFVLDYPLDPAKTDETGSLNRNTAPVMRYAEVLLDYAEAKAELGQMTADIWQSTIGALRKRAGIDAASDACTKVPTSVDTYLQSFYPGVTNATILEIRRERAIELFDEGSRPDDIVRWGCGQCLVNLVSKGTYNYLEGMNLPAGVDTPIDIDGDGTNDYYFSAEEKKDVPAEYQNIWVPVGKNLGLQIIDNGSTKQLVFKVDEGTRYWSDERRLEPMAVSEINLYKNNGHTLTQTRGYDGGLPL